MKVELSRNEETLLRKYFSMRKLTVSNCWEEPSLNELIDVLTGQLEDKKGRRILQVAPDPRYISKLKSIALNKIANSLENLARSMRLDYTAFDNYEKKKPRALQ